MCLLNLHAGFVATVVRSLSLLFLYKFAMQAISSAVNHVEQNVSYIICRSINCKNSF
jgi:hypothetical protein